MIVCDVVKNSIWYDPRVRKQIKEYKKRVDNVHAIGIVDDRYDETEIQKIGCPVHLVRQEKKHSSFLTKILWELSSNRKLVKEIVKCKPDVIHANDLNALIPAYKAAKKCHATVIYDTHEIFLENLWIAKNHLVKAVYGFFEKRIINKVKLVVCVSNAAKDYLLSKYKIKQIIVVTNSVSKEQIMEPKTIGNSFEVLNHGVFYEGRGYDLMIEAAKTNRNDKIRFVLRGFGTLEQTLKNECKSFKLNNVDFDPPVKTYELVKYASNSSVGLAITEESCLNFKLSVSNKLFEYAAAGLPVIMSKIPEHEFLNNKYKFGIVLDENTGDCLNLAINQIFNNGNLYNQLSVNAIAFSKEMCWEKEFDKLFNPALGVFTKGN